MSSPLNVDLDHIKVPKQVNSAMADFKKFALKGNVVDLAVGVIIGAAFGKIVTSLVEDIIMPPIGLVLGKVDFSSLYLNLSGQTFSSLAEAKKAGIPVIAYGQFLNTLINFVIVAFAVFLMVRQLSKLQRGEEKAPTTHECPFCVSPVSVKATRCPNCTSEIPAVAAPLAPASEA